MRAARTISSFRPKPKDNRPNSYNRGYNARWSRVRAYQLRIEPLCRICKSKEITKLAKVVDHIIPHKGNYELMWDNSNFQSLCIPCHNTKTATEDGGFGHKIKETTL